MRKHQPPKLARKLFEWYCDNAQIDDLLGDMDAIQTTASTFLLFS